ncbi:MAG: Gfo/Idh/MocA family oxidoreductase [Sedimentisphaerales bacterium]|nr:Gfo/Idh/MocA family oxidoreductase [Sedimentisphaerales bacterium]
MHESKLKSAIIGCGQIAGGYDEHAKDDQIRTHAKAYQQQPAAELAAVVDCDRKRAKDFSAYWSVPEVYTDAAKMLSAEKPDIVSICTPDDTHAEMLKLCLECPGVKAVWCEKPLATDINRAEAIVSDYERKGVVLAVNYWMRWDTDFRRIKSDLQKGEMGDIQKVVVYYTKGICHNGSHAVDLLMDWFGPPSGTRVFGSHVDFAANDPTVDARLLMGDIPVYFIGADAREYTIFEIDILGTLGRVNIKVSGREIKWFQRQHDKVYNGYQMLKLSQQSEPLWSSATALALQEIVEAVSSGKPVRSNGRSAFKTLKVCCELTERAKNL